MKKRILLLALIAAVALLFSCKKDENSSYNNNRNYEEQQPARPARVSAEAPLSNKGYALRVNTGFYKVKENTVDTGDEATIMGWVSNLSLGENILVGNPRKMTFVDDSNKKTVYNVVEVQLNDKNKSRGYAIENQIAGGGYLAVVVEDKAILYSAASTTKPTNTIISKKTVVVYFPDTENAGFVEVKGWDFEKVFPIPDGRYMRLSTLSKDDPDIQGSILLQTALSMKRDNQVVAREALLKAAIQDYPNSIFIEDIRKLLNPGETSQNTQSLFD